MLVRQLLQQDLIQGAAQDSLYLIPRAKYVMNGGRYAGRKAGREDGGKEGRWEGRREGGKQHILQFCMRETSTKLVHDDHSAAVLSNADAGMIRIRLLEQARLRKEADAYWERRLMQTG